MAKTHKKTAKDPFMLERFATEEVLHSTLTRLRGRYSVLTVLEKNKERPNVERIDYYRSRISEISAFMDAIINSPIDEKKIAIKLYSKELRTLLEESFAENYKNRIRNFPRS